MTFYTYLYLREDGTPYYVGKGSRYRASHPNHFVPVPPEHRILIEPHLSEMDAFEAERFLISYYGRKDLGLGCLRNHTDGGDGASGAVRSLITKKKLSEALKGHSVSLTTRQKIAKARRLIPASKRMHRKHTDAEKLKMKAVWRKTHPSFSKETRQKLSVSLTGNKNAIGGKKVWN